MPLWLFRGGEEGLWNEYSKSKTYYRSTESGVDDVYKVPSPHPSRPFLEVSAPRINRLLIPTPLATTTTFDTSFFDLLTQSRLRLQKRGCISQPPSALSRSSSLPLYQDKTRTIPALVNSQPNAAFRLVLDVCCTTQLPHLFRRC